MFNREKAVATIETGRCPCDFCRGELTQAELSPAAWRHCRTCRCAWKIQLTGGVKYAAHVVNPNAHRDRPA